MNDLLRTHKLTNRFPGVVALSDVNFHVRPGEIHALMAENGAGKSTLIKAITGVNEGDGVDSGRADVEARPARGRALVRCDATIERAWTGHRLRHAFSRSGLRNLRPHHRAAQRPAGGRIAGARPAADSTRRADGRQGP